MSTVVDKRIVEMDFDNADFESNVKTSLSTLDRLKMSLSGLPATVDFGGVASVSDSIQNGLTNSFQNVANNVHSIFARIGNTILTDTVLQWKRGIENIIEEASVRQLAAGWNKYAEKTKSVQTIMAATKQAGESEEEAMARVNEQLEKLMWFSDETSYSFNDMVNNIGKFTSQGIELDKATNAMMGISNWAAVSGAGVSEASRAMYNLSQALALGSVRLMDWKSIENANMATKEFKENVIESALAIGTLAKDSDGAIYALNDAGNMIKDEAINFQNMSQTLAKGKGSGWFNNEVLMDVLGKYSEFAEAVYEIHDDYDTAAEAMADMDKSGFSELAIKAFQAAQEAKTFQEAVEAVYDAASSQWSAIFEKIFGDYLNAKVVWTDLANWMWDVFAEPLDVLNSVLSLWNNINEVDPTIIGANGSYYLVEGLTNILDIVLELISIFRGTYRDAIGSASEVALGLFKASQKFHDMTVVIYGFIEEHNDKIARSFKILSAPIRIAVDIIKSFFNAFSDNSDSSGFRMFSEDVLDITASLGDYIDNIVTAIEESGLFYNVFDALIKGFKAFANTIKDIVIGITNSSLFKVIKEFFEDVGISILGFFESIGDSLQNGGSETFGIFSDLLGVFGEFGELASGPLSIFFDIISKIFTAIGNFFSGKWNDIKIALQELPNFLKNIIDKFNEFWNNFKGIFGVVDEGFSEFADGTKTDASNSSLNNISNFVESANDVPKLDTSLLETLQSFGLLESVDITKIVGYISGLGSVGAIAASTLIGVLAVTEFIKKLTEEHDPISRFLDFLDDLNKTFRKTIKEAVSPLKVLAFAKGMSMIIEAIGGVAIKLAIALAIMALIPADKFLQVTGFMIEAFGGLALIFGIIVAFSEKASNNLERLVITEKFLTKLGLFTAVLGTTMLMFAASAWILAKSEAGFGVFLQTIGFIGELIGSLFALKKLNFTETDAAIIFFIGASMTFIGAAIIELAAAAYIFSKAVDNGNYIGIISVAVAIGSLTLAMLALAGIVHYGNFGMEDAAVVAILCGSMIVLGIAIGELAIAALLFNHAGDGINKMIPVMITLGAVLAGITFAASKLDIKAVGNIFAISAAMIAFAGSMVILAGAAKIFQTIDPEDMGSFGIALAAIAGALIIISVAAGILGNVGMPAIAALAGLAATMLTLGATVAMVGIAVKLFQEGLEGLTELFRYFKNADISAEDLENFINNFAEVLKSFASVFFDVGEFIFTGMLDFLVTVLSKNSTKIFTLAVTILTIFCDGINALAPKLMEAVANITKVLFMLSPSLYMLLLQLRTMATVFFSQLLAMLFDWITMSLQMLEDHAEDWGNRAALIISKFYIGFVNGLEEMSKDIIDETFEFILGFIQDMIDALDEYGPLLNEKGWELFEKLIYTMFESEESLGKVGSTVESVAFNIIDGLVKGLSNSEHLGVLGQAAWGLADKLISSFTERTQIESPSKVFEHLAGYIPEGIALGIKEKTDVAVGVMKDSADSLLSPMKDSITSLFTDLNGEDMNPVISPILDLTNVEDGMGDLSSYFNSDNFNLSGSYSAKASSASSSGFSGGSSDLNNMFASLMDKLNTNSSQFKGMADTPVNVNVMLEGDTKKIFQVVQRENSKFKLSTGHGGF